MDVGAERVYVAVGRIDPYQVQSVQKLRKTMVSVVQSGDAVTKVAVCR